MVDKVHALDKSRVLTLCGLDLATHDVPVTTIPGRVTCKTCTPQAKAYWAGIRASHRDDRTTRIRVHGEKLKAEKKIIEKVK